MLSLDNQLYDFQVLAIIQIMVIYLKYLTVVLNSFTKYFYKCVFHGFNHILCQMICDKFKIFQFLGHNIFAYFYAPFDGLITHETVNVKYPKFHSPVLNLLNHV